MGKTKKNGGDEYKRDKIGQVRRRTFSQMKPRHSNKRLQGYKVVYVASVPF